MAIDKSFRVAQRSWSNIDLDFRVFANKKDFFDQTEAAIEEVSKVVNGKYIDRYGDTKNFNYARHVEKSQYFDPAKSYVDYEEIQRLDEYLKAFDEIIATVDMGGAFKKARLKVTEDKRGVFTFALASKGLYKPQEYFSQEIADDHLPEFEFSPLPSGIVPPNKVRQVDVLGQRQFWYTSDEGKEYLLTKQDEGKRAIELNTPGAKIAFKTSNKKSYLMFEKKGGKAKMVEIYFPIHASVKLNHIFPLILAARYFQSVGIKTRISVIRVYEERHNYFVGWAYPIKDYEDELDFNNIALQGVDNRWWDLIRVGVRALHDLEKVRAIKQRPSSFWDGSGDAPGSRADYVALFSRFRNFYRKEIDEGRQAPLRVDKKLILVGGTYSVSSGASITVPRVKEQVVAEFFRIIDGVDFQFNKPEEVCRRIYKRLVEDKLDEYYDNVKKSPYFKNDQDLLDKTNAKRIELTAEYKVHVQELLTDTYRYPMRGQYAEDTESAEKMEDEYDEKMDAMSQFLKTL
jgi:hypothetical protein